MKITDVRARLLVFPLPAPFMPAWARGRPMRELTIVLVEVETDEGITGLGAANAGAEAVIAVERFVRPYLMPATLHGFTPNAFMFGLFWDIQWWHY